VSDSQCTGNSNWQDSDDLTEDDGKDEKIRKFNKLAVKKDFTKHYWVVEKKHHGKNSVIISCKDIYSIKNRFLAKIYYSND
jgi:hypothetical protein